MTLQQETTQTLHWYFAASLPMYHHPVYEQAVRLIQANLPFISLSPAKLIGARGLYRDAKDWLAKWPELCESTINGGLFFIRDTNGWIGKGVHVEIGDVLKKGLPVYLVEGGSFYPIASLTGDAFVDGPDWKMYTFVDVKKLERLTFGDKPDMNL